MRLVLWTVGMGLLGFGLGWFGQGGHPFDVAGLTALAIFVVWGSSVGYGFGSIFDPSVPRRRLVIYWVVTLAWMSLVFSGFAPFHSWPAKVVATAVAGALLGALVGTVHLKQTRRTFRDTPHETAAPSSPVR